MCHRYSEVNGSKLSSLTLDVPPQHQCDGSLQYCSETAPAGHRFGQISNNLHDDVQSSHKKKKTALKVFVCSKWWSKLLQTAYHTLHMFLTDIMSPKSTKEWFINLTDCGKQTRTLEVYVQGNWTVFGVFKTFRLSLGFLSSKKKCINLEVVLKFLPTRWAKVFRVKPI